MPKLSGPFTLFRNFDQINLGNIIGKLKSHGDVHVLENFFGNRIIYPQTIPVTSSDMEKDMALFGEAIKNQPDVIMRKNNSILLTNDLTRRFLPLPVLIKTIINNTNLPPISTIYLKKDSLTKIAGSILLPKLSAGKGEKVTITVNGQILKLNQGSFSILPFQDRHLRITINTSPQIAVSGGEIGVVVDLTR